LVLAIGTPAPGAQGSALHHLREQARGGAAMRWVEYAAAEGCALDDRAAWRRANPALAAGLLHADVLEAELALVSEAEFRSYRLGQWVDTIAAAWLPSGAWEACPTVAAPPAGAEVVLAVAGDWEHSIAVVGSTLDGALFLAWGNEMATDEELAAVLEQAGQRWRVVSTVFAPRIRPNLTAALDGVDVWPRDTGLDVESATEWRRAIVEGRVPHDHHELVGAHVAALALGAMPDGSLRLAAPPDGRPVDAARAARMAWWRAHHLERVEAPAIF
jgi:hypothetical protein